MEEIQRNHHWARSSCKSTNIQVAKRFENLSFLEVQGSGSLKYLLSSSTARFMMNVKHLHIIECKVMEEVLHIDEEETLADALFPRLECLFLQDLPILKRFCTDSNVEFPLLKNFIINNCPKLKTFAFRHASSNMEVRKGLVEINSEDNRHATSQLHINESIVLANLESLEQSLIDLEEKQQSQHWARSFCKITNMQTSIRFQNLLYLGVWGSDSFKYLLSSSIARSMVQVKDLHIVNCNAMEEILFIEDLGDKEEEEEEEDEEIIPKMLFPRLEVLILRDLPILKRFCVGGNIEFKSMRSLFIEHCPKLKTFVSKTPNSDTVMTVCKEIKEMNTEEIPRTVAIQPLFSEEVVFPNLDILKLSLPDMEEIQRNHHWARSSCKSTNIQAAKRFENLSFLEVQGSGRLKYLLSSSTARFMMNVKHLHIIECKVMEEVLHIDEEETLSDALFPRLERFALEDLPILKGFCIDSNVEFPLLKSFSINHCPKLKTYAFRHASSNMEVRKGLVEINSEDNRHTTSQSHINESLVFANLESLEQSLIDLEEKQQNQHWARSFCKITNIQTSIRFQNLSALGVWGSDSFKYLLSSSVARSMVQLKYLRIVNCKAMEEILFIEDLGDKEEEEEEEIIPKMLFPRLELLKLNCLPILKRFCVGGNIEFKSMRTLLIQHCPKLKTFISKPSNSDTMMTVSKEIKEINTEEIPRTFAIQPLFSEEVAFPNLEDLEISYVDDLKIIWDNQIPPYSFCKLLEMKVEFCENLMNIFQSDMLTRFGSLENLTITDCDSLQEVFQLQEQDAKETHDVTVIPLKELRLDRVPKLKYVWNKDPQGIFNFPNLNLDSTGLRSYWSDSVPSD